MFMVFPFCAGREGGWATGAEVRFLLSSLTPVKKKKINQCWWKMVLNPDTAADACFILPPSPGQCYSVADLT